MTFEEKLDQDLLHFKRNVYWYIHETYQIWKSLDAWKTEQDCKDSSIFPFFNKELYQSIKDNFFDEDALLKPSEGCIYDELNDSILLKPEYLVHHKSFLKTLDEFKNLDIDFDLEPVIFEGSLDENGKYIILDERINEYKTIKLDCDVNALTNKKFKIAHMRYDGRNKAVFLRIRLTID